MALDFSQPLPVPFTNGLNQKLDDRFRDPPALDICKDVQFDDVGGLNTRYPYSLLTGSAKANARRVVQFGDELLLFTKDTLYTWDSDGAAWVSKGTHLAVKIEESPRFVTTGDQITCDRAELSGRTVYAWTEGTSIYAACSDTSTGAVVVGPTLVTADGARPRLVALSTKIIIFWQATIATPNLLSKAIDPDNFAATIDIGIAGTAVLASPNFGLYYDAVKIPGADTAVVASRRVTTTSYTVATVTAGLTVTAVTKARTCDGPIAVSCHPSGTHVQVIRANAAAIEGDYLTIALADVTTAQAVGTVPPATVVDQIAACHRSTTDGGAYRCYVFWDNTETTSASGAFQCKYNYVDTAGTIGTEGNFLTDMGVASRAFEHDGRVYVHMVFAGASLIGVAGLRSQLQTTYFLYRDDAFLVAKELTGRGGGFSPAIGSLPGVTGSSGVFKWCATDRRIIPIGTSSFGYADRGPRDVTITFDSNEARRTARLGQTLYISGGEILAYDGVSVVEVGFHTYPWTFTTATGAAGNIADGDYTYKETWRYDNAKGERDRSTTATTVSLTMAAGPKKATIGSNAPLRTSHKSGTAVEIWRTAVNPTVDADFYLVTGEDPGTTTGDNCYVALPSYTSGAYIASFSDNFADATLITKQANPENGDVLENIAPPPATIIAANDTRLFLAGVAGDPDRVWYSKQRNDGEVAAFHEALTFSVPRIGGDITALAFLNDMLVVFRETAIYAVTGSGFDNTMGGQNYSVTIVSTDVGAVSHEAVALTPMDLVFKSSKGWYSLSGGGSLRYIGGPVRDYDSDTARCVHVVESKHEIRILTSARLLVLDYLVNQWAEHTISTGVHATIWNGTYGYVHDSTGFYQEQTSYSSLTYGYDVETAWIKLTDLQGFGRVRKIMALGEYRSAHHVRIRIAYNYVGGVNGDGTYVDDMYWTTAPTTVGGPLQVKIGPSRQQCEAIKIRLTAVSSSDHASSPTGEAAKLTGLSLEVGRKPGLYKHLPAAQRT